MQRAENHSSLYEMENVPRIDNESIKRSMLHAALRWRPRGGCDHAQAHADMGDIPE